MSASAERLTTFVDCLAVFRPDPEVLAEHVLIESDPRVPPIRLRPV